MPEFSGRMTSVDLDGPDGCAEIVIRVLVPVAEAPRLAGLMLYSGSPIRVQMPLPPPTPTPSGAADGGG